MQHYYVDIVVLFDKQGFISMCTMLCNWMINKLVIDHTKRCRIHGQSQETAGHILLLDLLGDSFGTGEVRRNPLAW